MVNFSFFKYDFSFTPLFFPCTTIFTIPKHFTNATNISERKI